MRRPGRVTVMGSGLVLWSVLLLAAFAGPAGGAAPPVLCDGACEIPGGVFPGFVPPLAVVTSGTEVTWVGLDNVAHINLEHAVLSDIAASCLRVVYAGATSGSATLRLTPGGLVAEADGVERACTTASSLPDGSALLTYQCVLHPLTMKGALLVVA